MEPTMSKEDWNKPEKEWDVKGWNELDWVESYHLGLHQFRMEFILKDHKEFMKLHDMVHECTKDVEVRRIKNLPIDKERSMKFYVDYELMHRPLHKRRERFSISKEDFDDEHKSLNEFKDEETKTFGYVKPNDDELKKYLTKLRDKGELTIDMSEVFGIPMKKIVKGKKGLEVEKEEIVENLKEPESEPEIEKKPKTKPKVKSRK